VAGAQGGVFPWTVPDPDAHLAFAARFGVSTEGHPVIPGIPGYPNIFEIDYTKSRELYATYGDVVSRRQGIDWHTDVTFVKRPPLGSILNAKVIPPSGRRHVVVGPGGRAGGPQSVAAVVSVNPDRRARRT